MTNIIETLGRESINTCRQFGRSGIFLLRIIFCRVKFSRLLHLTLEEIYYIGVYSLVVIAVAALFVGYVVGLQGFNTLEKFASTANLGQMVALSITRELGPVLSALLFIGRACSALTAEIALMKTTEQLSTMEMMGVDPLWRIIAPRFWAGVISLPILGMIFSVVAIYGGYLVGVRWLELDSGTFWNVMHSTVNFRIDVLSGIIKSIVFGVVASWIAVYQGFVTEPTALGISRATTKTVVWASLAILGLDAVLTSLMIEGW